MAVDVIASKEFFIKMTAMHFCTNAKDLQIMEFKDTIAEQRQLISTQCVALDISNAQTAELTRQIKLLNEQLEYMKKKLFGTSSKKSQLDEQINLFNEGEQEANFKATEPEEATLVNAHARKQMNFSLLNLTCRKVL